MPYDLSTLILAIHDNNALRAARHKHEGPNYTTGWCEARCYTAHDVVRRMKAMGLTTPTFAETCDWCATGTESPPSAGTDPS